MILLDTGTLGTSREINSEDADGEDRTLYWYHEFLCPVEPLYFSDGKSISDSAVELLTPL